MPKFSSDPLELFWSSRHISRLSTGIWWWSHEQGATRSWLGQFLSAGVIYAGSAGATHWPSGKRSTNTLWGRVASMYLGSNRKFSTFRSTLGAILAEATGRDFIDEGDLTAWMNLHLRVLVVCYEDADALGRVERSLLNEIDSPLNLKGMSYAALRERLKILRRQSNHTNYYKWTNHVASDRNQARCYVSILGEGLRKAKFQVVTAI